MNKQQYLDQQFQEFVNRIEDQDVKNLWLSHSGIKEKFYNFVYNDLLNFTDPVILEFGVRHGCSTALFLDICNQKNGNLYSVDINDYSYKFKNQRWKFICSEDNDLNKIEQEIPSQFDVIFLDTIHKADHVSDIFYKYYDKLKIGGMFLVDDISWLPYTSKKKHNDFFKEINNKETFYKLLEIYANNRDKFYLNFNFCDTGAAKIVKINNDKLILPNKIKSREYTVKNLMRKLYINFKN